MRVSDLIEFRKDLFFDGAVQLSWVDKKPEIAELAAKNFIFHGQAMHAVGQRDVSHRAGQTLLKDTVTFTRELVQRCIEESDSSDHNPFTLAIAGYGAGKSHLAVTIFQLLSDPFSETSAQIIENLRHGDQSEAEIISGSLNEKSKPFLVISIDGSHNFNLEAEVYRKVCGKLTESGLSLEPIRRLSPRFQSAETFVSNSFEHWRDAFADAFGKGATKEGICAALQQRDEEAFDHVDAVFTRVNGVGLPREGAESLQELIDAVCQNYCGENRTFRSLIILFDELGRFLEYAADHPKQAGDIALQQIFEGVQNNRFACHFVGFVQYQLKMYLNILSSRGAANLQRYVDRYSCAETSYLSSNLETLIAHLIKRKNQQALKDRILEKDCFEQLRSTHKVLTKLLPTFTDHTVWNDFDRFVNVIGLGCWPLDPLTVWFISQSQDAVQSRSAISFVQEHIASIQDETVDSKSFPRIYAAEFLTGPIFNEMLKAERIYHSDDAEMFAQIRAEYEGKFEPRHELVMASVLLAKKLRIQSNVQVEHNGFIALASGLSEKLVAGALKELADQFNVLHWNKDTKRYEFVTNQPPRSSFEAFLNKKINEATHDPEVLFELNGKKWCMLFEQTTDFSNRMKIATGEWKFEPLVCHSETLLKTIQSATTKWRQAVGPDEPRGQLIYCYAGPDVDLDAIKMKAQSALDEQINKVGSKIPVLIVFLFDALGEMRRLLIKVHVLSHGLSAKEKEQFEHFLESEKRSAETALAEAAQECKRARQFVTASSMSVQPRRIELTLSEIFEITYPNAIPFEFDGFATTSGNGKADCASIARALAISGLNQTWITTQDVKVKNRVDTALIESWQVLTKDYKLAKHPGQPAVREIVKQLGDELKKSETTSLANVFNRLVRPPYGMNSFSAVLFIGYWIAQHPPRKVLRFDGNTMATADWCDKLFGGKKKNNLELAILERTEICFIPDDVASQWRDLITACHEEKTYSGKIQCHLKLTELQKSSPVPPEFQTSLELLSEPIRIAQQNMKDYSRKLSNLKSDFRNYKHGGSTDLLMLTIVEVSDLRKNLNEEAIHWGDTERTAVDELIEECKQEAVSKGSGWIKQQTCRDPLKLTDFKRDMQKLASVFDELHLRDLSAALRSRIEKADAEVKWHQTWQGFISQAKAQITKPLPGANSAHSVIDEELKFCKKYLAQVQNYLKQAQLPELQDAEKALLKQEEALSSLLKQQADRIAEFLSFTPTNRGELARLSTEGDHLRSLFVGLAEAENVQARCAEFQSITRRLNELDRMEISPAEMSKLIMQELASLDASASFARVILENFQADKIKHMKEAGDRWLKDVIPTGKDIGELNLRECMSLEASLDAPPPSLSDEQLEQVADLRKTIADRRAAINLESARDWMQKYVPTNNAIYRMDLPACIQTLRVLEEPPPYITNEDLRQVEEAKISIHERQDSLDVQQLINRIKKMPKSVQMRIAEQIQELIRMSSTQ